MKTRVCLKYFANDCLCKQYFAANLLQTPSNLMLLINFFTLRPLTLFHAKIRATKFQKVLKFVLLDNYFPDLYTEVQISYWNLFKFGLGCFLERQSKFQPKYDCF